MGEPRRDQSGPSQVRLDIPYAICEARHISQILRLGSNLMGGVMSKALVRTVHGMMVGVALSPMLL